MRLATVLTPPSPEHLELAVQCGVTDYVTRYPKQGAGELANVKRDVSAFGLKLSVLEGFLPFESLIVGQDDGSELAQMKDLIRTMGELEIPILCYNFMPATDWARTRVDVLERGGAKVSEFNIEEIERAFALNHDGTSLHVGPQIDSINASTLWDNLERMLNELVPVAEQANVKLAMHPDDPPLSSLLGNDRIMNCVEDFERLVRLCDSRHNGICFCQGNFAAMGVDIPATIRQLGNHIHYVHFRDVRGTAECFTETFHDNGPTDMVAAIQAYRDAGFDGPIRPDHVPQMAGAPADDPGYTMVGRLFAYGYMRALIQATE